MSILGGEVLRIFEGTLAVILLLLGNIYEFSG
jgi:hypothetical protein